MKIESVVLVAKMLCYLAIGFFTPLGVGLAQWANTGDWPTTLQWIILGASSIVGSATQLLSFFSGSFSDYMKQKQSGGGTDFFPKPTIQIQNEKTTPVP